MADALSLAICSNPAHRLVLPDGGRSDAFDVVFDPSFDPGGNERCWLRFVLPAHVTVRRDDLGRLEGFVGDTRVVVVNDGVVEEHRCLTAFATRFLADNGVPLKHSPTGIVGAAPATMSDLHTHFAAALPGRILIELGIAHEVSLSAKELHRFGFDAAHDLLLRDLGADALARLANSFDLPVDRQVTFNEMQQRYGRRAPLSKHRDLFVPQLEAIACKAAAEGCRYLELSLFDILGEPGVLALATEALPRLQETYGITIRFLFALSRHDDLEWDLDMIERLRVNIDNPTVVGFDFMGHERNSTKAFVKHLEAAASLASLRPGLVVRVHAGENPAQPENVRVAVETLLPAVKHHGLELRIGHGLYGVDEKVFELMREHPVHREGFLHDQRAGRVVVEFNLTSNLALNNIQQSSDVPLCRFLEAGVDVVLGTDGAGLYRTCLADEAAAAVACGVSELQLEHIVATEARLLQRKRLEEDRRMSFADVVIPPLPALAHYTPAFTTAQKILSDEASEVRHATITDLGITVVVPSSASTEAQQIPQSLRTWMKGTPGSAPRRVLVLSAAWKNALAQWSVDDVARTRTFLALLVSRLGQLPGGAVVVTGGTSAGIEGIVHELVATARAAGEPTPAVLGVTVNEVDPCLLDRRIDALWLCTDALFDKQQPLCALAQATRAAILFIGGGPIVLDEIQAAQNHGLRFSCVGDVPGSSSAVAALQPERAVLLGDDRTAHSVAVDHVITLLQMPHGRGLLRHPGGNDAVDVVVLREVAGNEQVLLIVRNADAGAEGGHLALPGGFVNPDEDPTAAAARVVAGKTDLTLDLSQLHRVDVIETLERDPRNTRERWVRTHLYVAHLGAQPTAMVHARRGTSKAFFVDVDALPGPLAFDHDDLLERVLARRAAAGSDDR